MRFALSGRIATAATATVFAFYADAQPAPDTWTLTPADYDVVTQVAFRYTAASLTLAQGKGQFESTAEFEKRKAEVPLQGNGPKRLASEPRFFAAEMSAPTSFIGICTSDYDADKELFKFSCFPKSKAIYTLLKDEEDEAPALAVGTDTNVVRKSNGQLKHEVRVGYLSAPKEKNLYGNKTGSWDAELPMPRDVAKVNGNHWQAYIWFKPKWPYGSFEPLSFEIKKEYKGKQVTHRLSNNSIIGQVVEIWVRASDTPPGDEPVTILAKFDAEGRLLAVNPQFAAHVTKAAADK